MENTLEKPYYIKFKALIILLAIASMLFMTGYHAICLFAYEYTYGYYGDSYALRFQMPTVSDFIYIGLSLVPYLLVVLYVAVSGNGRRATILLPIALFMITLAFFQQDILLLVESYYKQMERIVSANLEYIGKNLYLFTSDTDFLMRKIVANLEYLADPNNRIADLTRNYFYSCVGNLPLIVALILATVSAFRGWRSKVCITMASTAGLLYVMKYYVSWMSAGMSYYHLEEGRYLSVIGQPLLLMALFTGFMALFVLGVKSNLKPVFASKKAAEKTDFAVDPSDCIAESCEFEEEPAEEAAFVGEAIPAEEAAPAEEAIPVEEAAPAEEAIPVEEAAPAEEAIPVEIDTVKELKLLKYKLELGLISEEDYQQQQKELIEKL